MRRLNVLGAVWCTLSSVGCGGTDTPPSDAAPQDAAPSPSDSLFPTDRVLQVQITLAASDWDTLRNQQPARGDGSCKQPPMAESYTYFPASISVDGVTVGNVAVRKKGNLGSLSTTRPGLRVKLNEYTRGQNIAGLKVLTLNNNHQDETRISQCLGYSLFAKAGLPTPRCAFARVTVNGQDLGIYSHVESIRDEFLARHFADTSGDLYESGGDFTANGVGGFQPKQNESAPDCSGLQPVATALAAPDAELAGRVGEVVDLDRFYRFWAMEVITDHWDGYANNRNNYYFYQDPVGQKLHFFPWGTDALFQGKPRTTRPKSVYACGAMTWRLYNAPATRSAYLSTLRQLLATVWNEAEVNAQIDRYQAMLNSHVDAAALASKLAATREFVANRRATLQAEIDAGEPVWPYPAGESCLISIGTFEAMFTTTWGSNGQFPVGSGSMTGSIGGTSVNTPTLYATAGPGDLGGPSLQILGQLPDGRFGALFVLYQSSSGFAVGTQPIDLHDVAVFFTFYDPRTDRATGGGLVLNGTIMLNTASTNTGGPVSGTVRGTVVEL